MKVIASSLAKALRNAQTPHRAGQRLDIEVRRQLAFTGEVEDHTVTLISAEFRPSRDGRRWFDWVVAL